LKNCSIKYSKERTAKTACILLLPAIILCFIRCAQITPLTGGDRDTTPPKPLAWFPQNGSVQFSGRTIEIEFDEYIQLRDVPNQVVITPQLKELPDISAKGKKLIIKFQQDFRPNTTYHMNFGNSITDLHEGNAATGLDYVFSTGTAIDSLKLSGILLDAFTRQPVKDAWVLLYENENDSVVFRDKPSYLGKSAGDGSYSISYLKRGKYKVFALKDNNRNFIYDPEEQIGFFQGGMFELEKNDSISMVMFREDPPRTFLKKTQAVSYGKAELIFNAPLRGKVAVTVMNRRGAFDPEKYISRTSSGGDTLRIDYYGVFDDTLKVIVKHDDSADTSRIIILPKEEVERLKAKKRLPLDLIAGFNPGAQQPWFMRPSFRISRVYKNFDPSKILFVEEKDTMREDKVTYALARPDSIYISNKLKPEKEYQVIFYPGAFSDHLGISNDTGIYKFRTRPADYYTALTVNLKSPPAGAWLLQLYNSKGKVVRETAFNGDAGERKIKYERLDPDVYTMKLIEDSDANKKYSTGNYFKKTIPERVINYSQSIKLSGEWEMETDWKIEK
jgi:hypothetical protein